MKNEIKKEITEEKREIVYSLNSIYFYNGGTSQNQSCFPIKWLSSVKLQIQRKLYETLNPVDPGTYYLAHGYH